MNREAYDEWLEILEIGLLPQGKYALKGMDPYSKVNSYCCLGVLIQVALNNGVKLNIDVLHEGEADEETIYDDNTCNLPLAVARWAGLRDIPSIYCNRGNGFTRNPILGLASATHRNDYRGESFLQIAKAIRKHVKPI
jgi:hypothetical protein